MKLVREHIIFEKFTEDSDPIQDMGISYITIKYYVHFDTKKGKICSLYIHERPYLSVENFLKFLYNHHITYEIKIDSTPGHWPTVYFTGSKTALIKMCKEMFGWDNLSAENYVNKNKIEESINEKFTDEDSDPIQDMGIGLFYPRVFKTREELVNYIILTLPYIYGGTIPKTILKGGTGTLPNLVFHKICNFMKKYKHKMGSEGGNGDFSQPSHGFSGWTLDVRTELEKMGYKRELI